ncbi:ABC transporter ATP-binding protein [Anaerotruncus colihominis]|uniref:ABC transporter ATP-binding protein n=1 Tax=Anaerotruncus colihominis TaxID=169435 RepID=UPI0018975705|nr:ABC transporter ATP-binding protein [Anaerotruncus colihominis]
MLKINHIDAYYGKVQALHDVSLEVGSNEIISLIGANGAGKSTLMKTVMGLLKPRQGSVLFQGEDITKIKNTKIVAKGIVYVPEGREVFPELSVRDNLEMGAYCRKYSAKEMNEHLDEMYTIFPKLGQRQKQLAGSLSGGEQQMLAICRGLMSDPKLIMFDEPSLGLAPVIVEDMFKVIVKINQEKKIPVLLVEQNAYMALSISSRCYVMANGMIKLSGASKELLQVSDVKKTYLGG